MNLLPISSLVTNFDGEMVRSAINIQTHCAPGPSASQPRSSTDLSFHHQAWLPAWGVISTHAWFSQRCVLTFNLCTRLPADASCQLDSFSRMQVKDTGKFPGGGENFRAEWRGGEWWHRPKSWGPNDSKGSGWEWKEIGNVERIRGSATDRGQVSAWSRLGPCRSLAV